ncbi:MAG: STAS domain-containing protein [Thermodesulfobacteriota bacterium]
MNDKPLSDSKKVGDCIVLYTDGYLNGLGAEKLEDKCETIINGGYRNIVINFGNTEFINSIGISILIGVIEKISKVEGRLSFSNLTKINQETFEMLGLTKYVPIYETEEKALLHLKEGLKDLYKDSLSRRKSKRKVYNIMP